MTKWIVLVILLTIFVSAQSQYTYNCRRFLNCLNGGACNHADGTCTCQDPTGNYDCGLSDTGSPCNDLVCQNGGSCYTIGSESTCACPYGYSGTTCEQSLFEIICSGDKAQYSLLLPTNEFNGEVLLDNDGGNAIDAACVIGTSEVGTNTQYTIAIDISQNQDISDAPCKVTNVQTISDATTGNTLYRGGFYVRYINGITSDLDEYYYGNCSHEVETVLDNAIENVAVDKKNLTANEFADVYRAVTMVLVDQDDAVLTVDSALNVGATFKMLVHLTDTLGYSSLRLENCETNNTLAADDERKFVVLDQGCPTSQSKHLTQGQASRTYTVGDVELPAVQLPIEAFKFSNSDKMGIVCTARLCKADDNTCTVSTEAECEVVRNPPPTTTTTVAPGGGRRRRAADDQSATDDKETVSAVLTIRGPNDVSDRSRNVAGMEQPVVSVENCFARSEIVAVVGVLAAIVCILLIACLLLACMVIKRKAKSVEFESMPTPSSDRFRIPRAHVNDAFTLREV